MKEVAKSTFAPLAKISEKILQEQTYHLAHWQVWMKQLQQATADARKRNQERIEEAWQEFGDAFELGRVGEQMIQHHLIRDEKHIQQLWLNKVKVTLETVPNRPLAKRSGNGRVGEYMIDLEQVLRVLDDASVLAGE